MLRLYSFIPLLLCSMLFTLPISGKPRYPNKITNEKQIEALENKLIDLINVERRKFGLKKLNNWNALSECCKEHSQNMASGETSFGHDGFHDRSKRVRAQATNIKSVAENVAYNYGKKDPLKTAVDGWMNSPGHRKNILGNYNLTGVGIVFNKEGRCYLSQMFARKDMPKQRNR